MNILIIYGGKSCEHDISIITACLAKGYFDGKIYSAYFDKQNKCFLVPNNFTPSRHLKTNFKDNLAFCFGEKRVAVMRGKRIKKYIDVDVAVNCCHGVNGEDGCVSALCQMMGIPLVGSSMIASSIAMDKVICKQFLRNLKMPVLVGREVTKLDFQKGNYSMGNLGYPIIVKPSTLGSSIGITLCLDKLQLVTALKKAFMYDNKVLCEKALTNFYEVNCSAMRVKGRVVTSAVDNPITANDILTFEDKYVSNSKWSKPSKAIADNVKEQVKTYTQTIYQNFAFEGVVRVDYLIDNTTGKIYVNEINTIPGSLAYGLWSEKYSQREFGSVLIEQAIADYRQKSQLVYTYPSSVLNGLIRKK